MSDPDDKSKLRMAPRETPEDVAHRFEREQRAVQRQRESELGQSLAPYKVGSVPYLNAVPLTRGLEEQIKFVVPSTLAKLLQSGDLDAALVSVTEVLLSDRYQILDGIAVASLGEVKSVFLAHRRPLVEAREICCDPASLTSVHLLRVLLAEQGLFPEFKPLISYESNQVPDFALLIGDPAIGFLLGPHSHSIWDLGTAWYELTHLPFVYAVWAVRKGIDSSVLARHLREARDFGMETLDQIIIDRPEFDLNFRKDYLGWHIHYHLGSDEKRGLAKFIELLRKHQPAMVYEPQFIA
ncbi:MAG TPA: menaquinone biosynthesis protein [Verrucomicrobiae bacterium]|nr:menaquinone biosynthesis protein [Verrucomicrobiae bacterium]